MFWMFFVCHLILFIEVWWLIRKKLKRKAVLLALGNFIMMIVNLLVLRVSFSLVISTISYFQDYVREHFFLYLVWFLFNFFFLLLVGYCLYYAKRKKKQNKLLGFGVILSMAFLSLFFLIVFFQNSFSILLFFFLVFLCFYLLRCYLRGPKNYYLAALVLLFVFLSYSYFTYTGAARLYIALKGYPKVAYETGLEELKYYQEKNSRKYAPIQSIDCKEQCMYIIEVKNYGFVKIAKQ